MPDHGKTSTLNEEREIATEGRESALPLSICEEWNTSILLSASKTRNTALAASLSEERDAPSLLTISILTLLILPEERLSISEGGEATLPLTEEGEFLSLLSLLLLSRLLAISKSRNV
uniref:Uncharacterized protein n=1 Tax=Anopheles melas TaxID=34690 RepID=A0A182TUY8_9DIPT